VPSASLDPADDRHVGATLARRRRLAGLSGKALAARVGMNQPKISRIETGAIKPDPADVRRIAEALGLPKHQVAQLVEQAVEAHNDLRDRRAGLAGKQREVGDHEIGGAEVRVFEPTTVAGLLQTSAYARAVIWALHRMTSEPDRPPSEAALLEAVAGRIRRRENVLAGRTRVFVVLSEAALANRVVGDAAMLDQIDLLSELSHIERISLRVLPFTGVLPRPVTHNFELVDERCLIVDLFNTFVASEGRDDIRLYRQLFEEMWTAATPDVQPILAGYAQRYKSSPPP
jgi:transcriptional regulator with XRE-family HTH domain